MAKKKICPNCNEEINNYLQICPKCKYIFNKPWELEEKMKDFSISDLAVKVQLERRMKEKTGKIENKTQKKDQKKEKTEKNPNNTQKKKKSKKRKIMLLPWEYPKDDSANIRYQQLLEEQNRRSDKIKEELKKKWIDPNELEVIPPSKIWPKGH